MNDTEVDALAQEGDTARVQHLCVSIEVRMSHAYSGVRVAPCS